MVGRDARATVPRMPRPASTANPRASQTFVRGVSATARLVLVAAVLGVVVGCDRNVEPYEPGELPRAPDLARIFLGPSGGLDSAERTTNDTGQASRGAVPPSRAAGSEVAAEPAGESSIQGEIELASEFAMTRPQGGVLFVIARPQGARGGPPLAVLRIPSPDFPLAFSIGPDDVMIPTMVFAGAISLSARLDADGNAMTRGAGDISSPVVEPLSPGTTDVRLVLSENG